jgi:hypothetical protein
MFARSLQDGFQEHSSNWSASQAPTGPIAFDRIAGRPSQSSQPQPQPQPQPPAPSSQGRNPFRLNNTYPNGHSQPQPYTPSSLYFFNQGDNHFDPPSHPTPSQPVGAYDASSYGPSNALVPFIMGPQTPGLSTMGISSFSTPGINYTPPIPAAGSASQATYSVSGPFFPPPPPPRRLYAPAAPRFGLPGSDSSNGFAGYGGDVSSMTTLGNQPDTLNPGAEAPLQTWGADGSLPLAASPQVPPGDDLPNAINRANGIDWTNGLDAMGNPLSGTLKSFYEDLRDDPRKTEQEIKDLLANIRPDEEIPQEDRIGTPDQLRYPLYAHQQLALQWMMDSEKGKNKGGILADDVGLFTFYGSSSGSEFLPKVIAIGLGTRATWILFDTMSLKLANAVADGPGKNDIRARSDGEPSRT